MNSEIEFYVFVSMIQPSSDFQEKLKLVLSFICFSIENIFGNSYRTPNTKVNLLLCQEFFDGCPHFTIHLGDLGLKA